MPRPIFLKRIVVTVAAAVLAAAPCLANSNHPNPGHTGAPGEKDCRACHKGAAGDTKAAGITLSGLPGSYKPGEHYTLTLRLAYPPMKRAGFQISARFVEGNAPAGDFTSDDKRVEVTADKETGIRYVHHSADGVELTAPSQAEWRFVWQAPPTAGPVTFYGAFNGSNYDDSDLGDTIFLQTWQTK